MKKFLLGSSALVAMFASSAMAADMRAPVFKAAPPAFVPAYSWTGCYVGGNVGWAHERDKLSTFASPAPNNINAAARTAIQNAGLTAISGDGFVGGGQVGCNWQTSAFVLGVEGDFSFLEAKATRDTGNFVELGSGRTVRSIDSVGKDWLSTIRGRAGFAVDRVLFFATGGVAFAQFETTKNFAWDFADGCPVVNLLNECHVGGRSGTQMGWVVGGGVEWAVGGNWSIKAEYLHADFGNQSYTTFNRGPGFQTPASTQSAVHDVKATLDIVRAGLNYRF